LFQFPRFRLPRPPPARSHPGRFRLFLRPASSPGRFIDQPRGFEHLLPRTRDRSCPDRRHTLGASRRIAGAFFFSGTKVTTFLPGGGKASSLAAGRLDERRKGRLLVAPSFSCSATMRAGPDVCVQAGGADLHRFVAALAGEGGDFYVSGHRVFIGHLATRSTSSRHAPFAVNRLGGRRPIREQRVRGARGREPASSFLLAHPAAARTMAARAPDDTGPAPEQLCPSPSPPLQQVEGSLQSLAGRSPIASGRATGRRDGSFRAGESRRRGKEARGGA